MVQDIYVLWGEKSKRADISKNLLDFLGRKLDAMDYVWDGYYRIKDYGKNNELEKLLLSCLDENKISFKNEDRFYHSMGKGAIDYIQLLEKKDIRIPDAVIYPEEKDLPCLFKNLSNFCEFITFGGGTSVTGGLKPSEKKRFVVSIDSRNFNTFKLDKDSFVLEAGAGLKGPEIESLLNKNGLTLGHFPESFEYSTLGGWIATNAAGQESNRYGKIKDMLIGVKMFSPVGEFSDRPLPAESAFFRVSDIAIGSEGTYGIITKAWLKVNKIPERLYFHSYMFRSFHDGLESLRENFLSGKNPMISRLSDENETFLSILAIKDNFLTKIFKKYLQMRNVYEKGSLMILINDRKENLKIKNGINLGSLPAKFWYRTRYDRPYMYNDLLKRGIVAETIETSVLWKNVHSLYDNVMKSFDEKIEELGIKGMIMCHASHEYKNGTALYFTFLFNAKDDRERILMELRNEIIETIIMNGGSISHHHGIGSLLSRDLAKYKGEVFYLIKNMKRFFDPDYSLNPGIIQDEKLDKDPKINPEQ